MKTECQNFNFLEKTEQEALINQMRKAELKEINSGTPIINTENINPRVQRKKKPRSINLDLAKNVFAKKNIFGNSKGFKIPS